MKAAILIPYFNPLKRKSFETNLVTSLNFLLQTAPREDVYICEVLYTDPVFNGESVEDKLPKGVNFIRAYSRDLLFYKEQMLTLAGKQIAGLYDAVVTLDCDSIFFADDWFRKIKLALDTAEVVQCFGNIKLHYDAKTGKCKKYLPSTVKAIYDDPKGVDKLKCVAAAGAGWAYHSEVAASCGMFERNLLGSGDGSFLGALFYEHFGFNVWDTAHGINGSFEKAFTEYRRDLMRVVGSVAYADVEMGLLCHGTEKGRKYRARYEIFNNVDILEDFVLNEWGLYEWKDPTRPERQACIEYFVGRDDDENFTQTEEKAAQIAPI